MYYGDSFVGEYLQQGPTRYARELLEIPLHDLVVICSQKLQYTGNL